MSSLHANTNANSSANAHPQTLVLGIGNVLWADEGFGVRCVEELHAAWDGGDRCVMMDGGTQGLYLVPYVCAASHVLVFDAVDFGDAAGTLRVVRDRDVPSFMGTRDISLHQVGFQDVLAAAALLGRAPSAVTLVGVQPAVLEDYGGGLTDLVAGRIDDALAIALAELRAWGLEPRRRTRRPEPLVAAGIDRASYEGGRPSAEEACRIGDARFLGGGWLAPAEGRR